MANSILSNLIKKRKKEIEKLLEHKLIKLAVDIVYLTYDIEDLVVKRDGKLLKHPTMQKMISYRKIWMKILIGSEKIPKNSRT